MSSVAIDMSGKVALVTGGGYGMGRASSLLFARSGAQVVVVDRVVDRGNETVELVRQAGGQAAFFEADVSQEPAVEAMIAFTKETYGGLDYAHNNAGIVGPQFTVIDYPLENFEEVLATNLIGVYLCMKHEIPALLERGGGAIVNVASESTYKGNVADLAYTASKHGVVGLTTVVGLTYARRGIRVNAVAPGNVDTGIVQEAAKYVTAEQMHHIETVQPLRRLARPEEVAEVVVWLCSDGAGFVNAAKIAVDSGWHVT
ncbi:MAG: putative oxidoreductase, short chain dehydrogenase/reductase family [Pseudonocardiales bacterium]|nr:putative oxidoreductase, short chain dehydrogenase/reductase family [Pseudonocardiales bacterium]